MFGHRVKAFGFVDLVHGTGSHGVGSVGGLMGLRRLGNGVFMVGGQWVCDCV